MMKLSVSAWCVQKELFSKRSNLKQFIDFCKANGAEYVELLDCFWISETPEEIKKYLAEKGMKCSCYSVGNDFCSPNEADRKNALKIITDGVDLAVFFGAKVVRVFSGNVNPAVDYETGLKYIIEGLSAAAKYAEQKGITLALENHGKFAGTSKQINDIIAKVGSRALKSNSDIGNFLLLEENSVDAVKNINKNVAFVHFKDFQIDNEHGIYETIGGNKLIGTVIGEGSVDMNGVTAYLKSIGYDGFLSLEFEGEGDQYDGTQKSIQYTLECIKKNA